MATLLFFHFVVDEALRFCCSPYVNSNLPIVILRRSSNTNSFGLREHVIVANNGLTFVALRSAYVPDEADFAANTHHDLRLELDPEKAVFKDCVARAALSALSRCGFECVQRLLDCPHEVLQDIFKAATAA